MYDWRQGFGRYKEEVWSEGYEENERHLVLGAVTANPGLDKKGCD